MGWVRSKARRVFGVQVQVHGCWAVLMVEFMIGLSGGLALRRVASTKCKCQVAIIQE